VYRHRDDGSSGDEQSRATVTPNQVEEAGIEAEDQDQDPSLLAASQAANQITSSEFSNTGTSADVATGTGFSTASEMPLTAATAGSSNKRKAEADHEDVFGGETSKKQKTEKSRKNECDEV
jgi:hypothetical protein